MKRKKVAVLGATGSIGGNTLDVLLRGKDDFCPVLFTVRSDVEALIKIITRFKEADALPPCGGFFVAITDESLKEAARALFSFAERKKVFFGREGLLRAIKECGAEVAVNGIAGAAGLEPSLAVLESGASLALANKETVVMAWDIVQKTAKKHNAQIIPVDSEHSAVSSLINAHCASKKDLAEIILTASGGPFKTLSYENLKKVTPREALRHPSWKMGRKITIDSATLANKGLEVIEASRLFDAPPEIISVAIHPQSVVHSLIRLRDGALYAELSRPDMRLPIHKALYYPEIAEWRQPDAAPPALTFNAPLNLTFEAPDFARFPMLPLAYDALKSGASYTIAYNAANEVAVDAFLGEKITFTDIPALCAKVLERDWGGAPKDIAEVLETDRRAREALLAPQ